MYLQLLNEYILGSYTSLYDEQKPHTEYCSESHKYFIYTHILIHSDKNVELQLYAKIVFLKYVSSICLSYRQLDWPRIGKSGGNLLLPYTS